MTDRIHRRRPRSPLVGWTVVAALALGACSAGTGDGSVEPSAPALVAPTATPTPTPTPTPVPLPVEIVKSKKAASPNDSMSVTAGAPKGSTCSIEVLYESGPSEASGLKASKTADADGQVSWKWTVGSNANPQEALITVTCELDDAIGSATTTFTVKE